MTEEGTGTESLLQAAMEMARKAGEAHMRHFRSAGLQTEAKFNESDVVTVADKEAERIIISGIRGRFPSHSILSEESGASHTGRRIRWIIDPLDGTDRKSVV